MFQINLNDCEAAQEAEGSLFCRGSDEWPALEIEKEIHGRCLFICGVDFAARSERNWKKNPVSLSFFKKAEWQ